MNVLIVHQNFPGQFPHIADALVKRGDKVSAIGSNTAKGRPGVDLRRWVNKRSSTPGILEAAVRAEADLIRAQAAAEAAVRLKNDGFEPDLIIGHPGWGETLHLRDIFPTAKLILFGEFYYRQRGGDVNFDAEFETPSLAGAMRTNSKNATQALAYTMADLIISPTPFQASSFPAIFHTRIHIIHEGINLDRARRRCDARVRLPNGASIDGSKPVITFINRNFERLRGFHIFMRALPAFFEAVSDAHVIAVGADGTGYGGGTKSAQTWRETMTGELGRAWDAVANRVHFVGHVEHDRLIDILSISAAHVYYTYPFVLSWSLIEAMACECLILGSDTAPVRDAIVDGENGVLNDFFDVTALSSAMTTAAIDPQQFSDMRARARETALQFDHRTVGVPRWLSMIDALMA